MSALPTDDDWARLGASVASHPAADRARAAQRWARAAQLEHASIASFSRFSLELLALGAPPALLEGAHRAAIDEVRHARVSFRIASVLGSQSVGPGPLPLDRVDFHTTLEKAAVGAALDGCIVETVAALVAEEAARHAAPGAIRASLEMIARDESSHAQLAFTFLGWALTVGGAGLRTAVGAAIEARVATLRAEAAAADEAGLELYGLLSGAAAHRIHTEALEAAVLPALTATLRA